MMPDSSFNFDFIVQALSGNTAAPRSAPDTSARKPWVLGLAGVSLNGVHVTYDDYPSGFRGRFDVGTMVATVDTFDLPKLKFHVDDFSLAHTSVDLVQMKESPSDTTHSADVDFSVRTLSMSAVHFSYTDAVTHERYLVDLGSSDLRSENVDLPHRHIAVKNLQLENTRVVVVPSNKKEDKTEEPNTPALPWIISLDELNLRNNSFRYEVERAPTMKSFDPNHLQLDGLTMLADHLYWTNNRITADIHHTSLREHSGFDLTELSGRFVIDSLHAQFKDFTVETPGSRIHQNILLRYASIPAIKRLPGSVNVEAAIDDSHLAVSDLLFFMPSLPIQHKPGASIRFLSRISGSLKDLQIEKFHASLGDSTEVDLAGSIQGLPEAETAHYDVNLHQLTSGRNDIQALVPDTLLPKEIVIPGSINVTGNFKGTLKKFSASTVIATSIGNAEGNVDLSIGKGPDSISSRWKTDLVVDEFNVGLLLNDTETFGPVSLKASAVGTGLNKDDVVAKLNVQVAKAVVNGYPYRRLSIDGTASPRMFEGKAELQDSNFAFVFKGTVNRSKENPRSKFTLEVKGADLHLLNLTTDDIRVSGLMTSDMIGEGINDVNGSIDIRHVVIVKNNKRYVIDSLVYVSVIIQEKTHISIASTILAGQFDGTITPSQLPEVLKEHFDHYFPLEGMQRKKNLKPQAFSFHIAIRDPSTITDVFFPELHRISAGIIEGNFDSGKRNLNLNVDIPGIDYNEIAVDSLAVRVTSNPDLLQATLRVGSISDSIFRVTNLQLAASARHDSMDVELKSAGGDGSTKLLLAGVFNSASDGYKFHFNNDGIVFQNVRWNVPSDNYIFFGKDRFIAHKIFLQGPGRSLSLNSTEEKNNHSPLRIEFNDFDLATLVQVVERDGGLLGGTLTGNVVLQNLDQQMAFTSDLTIKDFSFGQRHVGDVTLRANNQLENIYDVKMNIAGNGNQIAVQGKYRSEKGGSDLDLSCEFTEVNLASIEPFTFGNVKRLSGTMTGGLHMTGTLKKPTITGNLNFANTGFTPTFLESYLHLNNGKIELDGKGVEFKSFDLLDTVGNMASLSGHLFTEDFRTFGYDFRVQTHKFLLLNKPARPDALYYGTVILDSDVSVKGDQDRPVVTVQAELDKGTDLAFVLPESELAVEERSGIVRFVDYKIIPNSIMSRRDSIVDMDSTKAKLASMDLTSNISVNKESRLRILIDPVAGDSLVLQGEATLSFTFDPSGKLTLTGRYEILGGSYQLSFGGIIKKEFAIEKGSSLTWTGSPYDADVDITAIYTVRAAVLDLVQDQLAGISQEERNKYRQELPIQVYLMMKGKLLKPVIHFKLDLPPNQRGALNGSVYAKFNELNSQESELNKQVFALLVLGRFIPQNPIASAAGNNGLTDFARSSVSQILSAQLNRLSEQYLAGANLNVGVDSYQDYSTGSAEGRTQLKLALSKQLFDERMTLQVGGNVDLEGRRSQGNSLNNFAGDLKVLYKLTEDGRWQMQVARQNSYEGAIDGDITKTGVGVVFTIDYEKLYGITLNPVLVNREK